MATIKRVGFGQVEPNHLSAKRTGQIYAQLPADDAIEILENGQFVKYDYASGECNFSGAGEWMMVFNEVKLYDDFWRESYKDFAMIADNYTPGGSVSHYGVGPFEGQMVPRVTKINVGDHWTTNCLFKANTDGKVVIEETVDGEELKDLVGKCMTPNKNTGYLELVDDANGDVVLQVVKVYKMADGQDAVKVMRVK
jgi:hypothetical protein